MILCPPGSQPVQVAFQYRPVAVTFGNPKPVGFKLFYLNSGPTAATMAAFKAAMDAAIAPSLAAAMNIAAPAPKITVKDMTLYYNPNNVFLPAANGAYAGSVIGDCLPLACSVNIEKLSAQSGKINRGQVFLPFVPEDGQDQGELTAGQIILYNAVGTALKTTITAGGQNFIPTIFSATLSNTKAGVAGGGIWMQPITLMDLDKEITNLKLRRPKPVYV